MNLETIKDSQLYTWINPITKKKENVLGERIRVYGINYGNDNLDVKEVAKDKEEIKPKSTKIKKEQ